MIEPAWSPDVTPAQIEAIMSMLTPLKIDVTPVDGGTVNMPNTSQEIILNLNPAAQLSTLNIVLPNDASSRIGQRIFIASTKTIVQATFSGTATVNNSIVMFSPGDNVVFFKNNTSTWSRLIG